MIAIFALCAFAPIIFSSQTYIITVMCFIGIYAVAGSGLDILFGYSGQISLGHSGFYAIGAYGSALLSQHFNLPVIVTMLLAAIMSALVGIVLAWPASKLKYHFLSLATIAFGEIIYLLLVYSPGNITNGFQGVRSIPAFSFFGIKLTKHSQYFYVVLVALVLVLIVKTCIVKSKVGRAFIAVRDNSVAADGMGINVRRYRIMAFAISAFFTAIAGSLYAHMVRFISPETFTMDNVSVMLLTVVLFGGLATTAGPLIGAVVITLLREVMQSFGSYQMVVYSAFIIVVLLFMPKGIIAFVKELTAKIKLRRKGGTADATD